MKTIIGSIILPAVVMMLFFWLGCYLYYLYALRQMRKRRKK
jgi:uncharacterized protein (DUF2062 family)